MICIEVRSLTKVANTHNNEKSTWISKDNTHITLNMPSLANLLADTHTIKLLVIFLDTR